MAPRSHGKVTASRIWQVTPVLIGAEFGRAGVENHFEGYVSEALIWNRPLEGEEVEQVFRSAQQSVKLQLGLLAHWRPIDAPPEEPDGRVMLFNSVHARLHTCLDAVLKRNSTTRAPPFAARAPPVTTTSNGRC